MSILYFFKLGNLGLFLVVISLTLFIDFLSFLAIKLLFKNKSKVANNIFKYSYWIFSLIIYSILVWAFFLHSWDRNLPDFSRIYTISHTLIIILVSKLALILFYAIQLIINLVLALVAGKNQKLNILVLRIGIIVSAVSCIVLIYSYILGRFNYFVNKEKLTFKDLPVSFDGLKIVQVSDLHLGIYYKHSKELSEVVNIINEQKPDIVFFTGDLINNFSEEVLPFIPIIKQINAKIGKYAILGNHDYGDYFLWENDSLRIENFNKLIGYIDSCGFKILRNENHTIYKNGDSLIIAGTENISPPPFRQVGDLEKTLEGTKENNFLLMLTHNPEFWKEKFATRGNLRATFSGHTHGMQLSISRNWSPLNFKNKDIAGLYKHNNNYLYINRGLGGGIFAGRIGMWPEISVFTLERK